MAKGSTEYELAIKIAGKIEQSFYNSTRITKAQLSEIAKEATSASDTAMSRLGGSLERSEAAFSGLENVARTTFRAVRDAAAISIGGIALVGGASILAGSEFESAFAGVKKTVSAPAGELEQIRDGLRQMAREDIPATAASLAGIAESAGQLGIGTEYITGFTETMANLAEATNLTSEEGASQFAQFANIVEMRQSEFDRLGSSVVALGNSMATTEADTVGMGMRIAAAGHQVKLSEAEIMAYSAALSSVGVEAEAGGSAFSKMLVNLQMAAETGKGLQSYASVAGMSAQQFKEAFNDDATKAINAFLSGLNDTERNGKSAIAVLDGMGIKEVRLRDTLLRAANASGMFNNALETSRRAWEENTALADEAAQRYATFESQCGFLKNKVTDLGISLYDGLRPGLAEAAGLANEFLGSISGKAIEDAAAGISKKLPSLKREARQAGEAIKGFAAPFMAVGRWLLDNPGLITGAIAGIGTALAAYKVAAGISSLASALGSLTPAGIAIMGIGGVAAVITSISTSVKKSAEIAKKANLDKHFGSISLSLKDLREAASFVVKSKDLDKIRESVSAMGELEGIADGIRDAAESINKTNWKASIGMELTEGEKEEYKAQAQELIDSTQEYITQKQYAATMSIKVLAGDGMESDNAITEINQFYAGKQEELAGLGKKLNETVTEAFRDGLLDIDEAEEIAKLQQQMANIQSSLAGNNFEAGLDLIGSKYGGQALDSESFMNLQEEIQLEMEDAMSVYDEAQKASIAQLRTMLNNGEWTQEKFDAELERVNQGYTEQRADLQAISAQFQADFIKQAYAGEIEGLEKELQEKTGEHMASLLDAVANGGVANINLDFIGKDIVKDMSRGMDSATQDALAELYAGLEPELKRLQESAEKFKKAGMEIPESIQQGIMDAATIGALSGDTEAIWALIADEAESEEYKEAIQAIKETGGYIPEEIGNAISDGQGKIDSALEESYRSTKEAARRIYSQPLGITMDFAALGNIRKSVPLPGHADGGIFTEPHIAWFAEDGPEAAIPLDGTQNAISIWREAGKLLGMEGMEETPAGSLAILPAGSPQAGSGGVAPQFVYSPTLQFYADASKEDVEEALETEQEKFTSMMEQYLKNSRRISFA